MDLKLLHDAVALIECGNLSRAAARRNVTQPAFSRRIRSLEDWVGAPLLVRRANGIDLSAELLDAEADIRALLYQADRLRRRITASEGHVETIVLATQHALAANAFPGVLAEFAHRRPDLSWRVRTLNREDCISLFVHGGADLLLCYEARDFPPLPFDASVGRRVWRGDTLIPIVGGSLRQAIAEDGTLRGPVPLLSYPSDSHFGRLLSKTRLEDGFGERAVGPQVESAFSVGLFELIIRGAGVGWIPHSMCRARLSAGDVVSLARTYGAIPLDITLFALGTNHTALDMISKI